MNYTHSFAQHNDAYKEFKITHQGNTSTINIEFHNNESKVEFLNSLAEYHYELKVNNCSISISNLICYRHQMPGIIGFANASDTTEELLPYRGGTYFDLNKSEHKKILIIPNKFPHY